MFALKQDRSGGAPGYKTLDTPLTNPKPSSTKLSSQSLWCLLKPNPVELKPNPMVFVPIEKRWSRSP